MKDKETTAIMPFLSEPMALAEVFFQSGMFTDVKSQAQAMVKILKGRELGLAPLESMDNIFIVNGKTSVNAKIIASLIKKSKKYDYKINKLDKEECVLTFYKEGQEEGKSSFTFKDAAAAGLVNKDVWKNYPKNMLFARALSNGAKWYCPDVFSGYTVEELESITPEPEQAVVLDFDANGEQIVNAEAENGKA
jgi:hypothetical protein